MLHPRVTVSGDQVSVRLWILFLATFPRDAVAGVRHETKRFISIGVHGGRGRWLVNGAWTRLVTIDLEPRQRARVLGVPVRLRQLVLSARDPEALVAVLT